MIGVIGDIHIGKHASDALRREHIEKGQDRFFEWMADYYKSRGVKQLFFTGDIYDHRTMMDIRMGIKMRRLFAETLKDFDVHIVQGNHDLFYKDSYEYSVLEFLSDIPNVTIYANKARVINCLNRDMYVIPWIVESREQNFKDYLLKLASRTKAEIDNTIILGHFELSGVKMEGNIMAMHGMESKLLLEAARLTISGHYHGQSEYYNGSNELLYVGSPYPLTFINANEPHGIYIVHDDLTKEFIENPVSPRFVDISNYEQVQEYDTFENCFVQVSFPDSLTEEEYVSLVRQIDSKHPITRKLIPIKGDSLVVDSDALAQAADKLEMVSEDQINLGSDLAELAVFVIESDKDIKLDKRKVIERLHRTLRGA